MRILAVDDNPFILDFLPAILQKTDFRDVSVAASGPQALDILAEAEAPFDCLLLDIGSPCAGESAAWTPITTPRS